MTTRHEMELFADWRWMRMAVDLAKRSIPEDGRGSVPRVGVVFVKDGKLVASGYRGQEGSGAHAEYSALLSAPADSFVGATAYTTLEPCTKRGPGKIPCAQRLVDAKIREVVIGMYDPNPHIFRQGWRILKEAGLVVRDFSPELRAELKEANMEFTDQYRFARGASGSARFDYTQNHDYIIEHIVRIRTRWSAASTGVIYAQGEKGFIAIARHATSFQDIDDPSALDFDAEKWQVSVKNNEIVVFGTPGGHYALVKIVRVLAADRGDPSTELELEYEVRLPVAPRSELGL